MIAAAKITGIIASEVALKAVASTATLAISEATERSSPRTRITKVCPSTTSASGAAWMRMSCRLVGDRNEGWIALATAISATSAAGTATCWSFARSDAPSPPDFTESSVTASFLSARRSRPRG